MPATGETMPFSAAAASLIALSKAERAVQHAAGDLPALGHLAQRRGIERGGHAWR